MPCFQLRHQLKNGQGDNVLIFENPVGNNKEFSIKRIQMDVSFASDVGVMVIPPIEINGTELTENVYGTRIGDASNTTARFYTNIFMEASYPCIRYAMLERGLPTDLFSVTDGMVLLPGQALMIKVKSWEISKWVNIFINYKENEQGTAN